MPESPDTAKAASVLVIDDHPAIRSAVRRALQREWTVLQAGTAADGQALARADRPVAAIVDLGLPDKDGFALVSELNEMGLRVVVFSATDDRSSLARAIAAGAAGFLGKSRHEQELVTALRVVLKGESFFPDEYAETAELLSPVLAVLTPAEQRVLFLIGEGYQTKAIAEKQGRSPRTIGGHRLSIAEKLKISASDLVQFAVALRNKRTSK